MSLSSIYYNNYRVVNLGAKPDGRTDSTKAFRSAWDKACASVNPAVIHVPRGTFLLGNAIFRGPCNNNAITFRIAEGTLVSPSDYRVLGNAGITGFCFRMCTASTYLALTEFLMAKALVCGIARPH
ncbi:polygalacturonase-like [Prunus yedoensis var. nudiflora]|uniref:Polygalacturonase-like n=1 Tax=Prunus yedoensis var. nudiflora TaxID=2094558 RepID=A0A314UFT7_PRUYE|nr:polygalacturonase-like [Prunus yedoensis var. nudiflora]